MTSGSRTVIAVAATALVVAAGACAFTGARSPYLPIPSPPECNQALTVGHVPGHVDRVWQLACAGGTTDSGQAEVSIEGPPGG